MPDRLRRFQAEFFQGLAHPTRIAILEMLREGEQSAGTIIDKLGMEQANVSQHLAILRSKQIVLNRKVGNQVFYSLRGSLIDEVLDLMKKHFHAHMSEILSLLEEVETSR